MAKNKLFEQLDAASELQAVKLEMQQKAGSKAHPLLSAEELAQRKAEGRTRGAKGAKADRINMAFTTDNFEYIRIMSKIRGESMTEFCNYIIAKHREEYPEEFEQARAIIEKMKR